MAASPPAPPSVEVGLAVLTETVRNMDAKMDHFVASKADKIEVGMLTGRMDKLEGQLSWAVKIILTIVIGAILASAGISAMISRHQPPVAPATQAR